MQANVSAEVREKCIAVERGLFRGEHIFYVPGGDLKGL
jgi:hypothetical protein